MNDLSKDDISRLVAAIDYSDALTVTASEADAREACRLARQYGFRAVVAFPQFLPALVDELSGSGVLAQIPVGFPCGGTTTLVKCTEAEEGLKRGASDLDMVMNITAFSSFSRYRVFCGLTSATTAVCSPMSAELSSPLFNDFTTRRRRQA